MDQNPTPAKLRKSLDFRKMKKRTRQSNISEKEAIEMVGETTLNQIKEIIKKNETTRLDYLLPSIPTPGPGRYNIAGNILKRSKNAKAGARHIPLSMKVKTSVDIEAKPSTDLRKENSIDKLVMIKDSPSHQDTSPSKLSTSHKVATSLKLLPMPEKEAETLEGRNKLFNSLLKGGSHKSINLDKSKSVPFSQSEQRFRIPCSVPRQPSVRQVKVSKQGYDNLPFVTTSKVRIKTQLLADLTNYHTINKNLMAKCFPR